MDLLGRACGLTYEDAAADAGSFELGGVTIPVASARTLIRTKQTPRAGDAADWEFLTRRLADEKDKADY
ncbi:MAG: hypothetical protein ACRD3M_07580 [Thermoanaerobaculia bacterium]